MHFLRACLNPRVLASLGIIGLAIAVLAPNLIAAAIPLLIVAACPLSMVVMMRAMSHRPAGLTTPADGADRVAELRRELAEISERSNHQVEPVSRPGALTGEALRSLRESRVQGLSRRQLLRASLGGGVGLWLIEVSAGTIDFLWPSLAGGFGAPIKIGTLDDIKLANASLPIDEGFPAYDPGARARLSSLWTPDARSSFRARIRAATGRPSTFERCISAVRTSAASRTRA